MDAQEWYHPKPQSWLVLTLLPACRLALWQARRRVSKPCLRFSAKRPRANTLQTRVHMLCRLAFFRLSPLESSRSLPCPAHPCHDVAAQSVPVTAARFAQRRLAHHPFVPVANGRYSKQAASVWCVPTVLLDSTAGDRSAQVSRVPCCATLLAHMMVLARPSRTPHGCRTRGPSVYIVAGLGNPPSSRGPS